MAGRPGDGLVKLPEDLSDLLPLLDEWSIADVARRAAKLTSASPSELCRLTDLVLPRVAAIDRYLNAWGNLPLDDTAAALLRLAESALEAAHELGARGETGDGTA